MKWQAYLTHKTRTSLTSEQIKKRPDYYKNYFEDLDNPTDEEVADFFSSTFGEMSDPWEIPANGTFRIDRIGDETEVGGDPNTTLFDNLDSTSLIRLVDNFLVLNMPAGEKLVIEAAAPIRVRLLASTDEVETSEPLRAE